jgi:uncharacterized Fe-S radical SAM superfamily protein PflX
MSGFTGRLPWYRAVEDNRMPAKYLIAARVPAGSALDATERELWQAFDAASATFLVLKQDIAAGASLPAARSKPSLLDLAAELARRMLTHCNFCRWECRVDRSLGAKLGARTLATMAWRLRAEGCHNVNWVGGDPAIHLHTIVEAIAQLEDKGISTRRCSGTRTSISRTRR